MAISRHIFSKNSLLEEFVFKSRMGMVNLFIFTSPTKEIFIEPD